MDFVGKRRVGFPPVDGVIVKGFYIFDDKEQTIRRIIEAFQEASVDYKVSGIIYPVGTKKDRAVVQFSNATAVKELMDVHILKIKRIKTRLKIDQIETVVIGKIFYIKIDPVVASLLPKLETIQCGTGVKCVHLERCFVSDSEESLQILIESFRKKMRRSLVERESGRGQPPTAVPNQGDENRSDYGSFVFVNKEDGQGVSKHVEDAYLERDIIACCVVIKGIDSKQCDLKSEVSKFLQMKLNCENATVYAAEDHAIAMFKDERDANGLLETASSMDISPVTCSKLNIPRVMNGGKLFRVQPTLCALFPDIAKRVQQNWTSNVIILNDDVFIIAFDHETFLNKFTKRFSTMLGQRYTRFLEPTSQVIDRKSKQMSTKPDDDSDWAVDTRGKGQSNVWDHTSQGKMNADEKQEYGKTYNQKEDRNYSGQWNNQVQQTNQKKIDDREKQGNGQHLQTSYDDPRRVQAQNVIQGHTMHPRDCAEGRNKRLDNDGVKVKPTAAEKKDEVKWSQVDTRTRCFTVHNDIYQFLITYQGKKLKEIERDHNVIIKWWKDKTELNLAVLSNDDEDGEERIFAENKFIQLYQSVSDNVKLQKVAVVNYKSSDIKHSVQITMQESQNVLLLHKDKDVLLIGEDNNVTQAKKIFKKLLGITVEEKRLKKSVKETEKSSGSTSAITVGRDIKVIIRQADITSEDVDVIVNAANGRLQHDGGVARAIAVRAGRSMDVEGQRKLKDRRSTLNVSEVLHTSGYNLNAKYVLHAVGPIRQHARHAAGPKQGKDDQFYCLLKDTFLNCLEYADEKLKTKSIAIPLISSGNFGGGKRECAKALATSVNDFVQMNKLRNLKEIRLVNIDAEATQEIQTQIDAIRGIPRPQCSAVAGNINNITDLFHAVIVEGFEIYESQEENKLNLVMLLLKCTYGKGRVLQVIYPVEKLPGKAVVMFEELRVAKTLIDDDGESTTNTEQNLQFKSIEVGVHWEASILDISMIQSSILLNRLPARCEDLGDGRLLLHSQNSAQEIETYFNNELEKWLNTQVDGVGLSSSIYDDTKRFSITQCVLVTGFEEYESQERTRDKLEIILSKQKYGGGDVEQILYPFGNTSTAVAIFCETSVARSLIIAKKMSNCKGQNLQMYPFKVGHQIKTNILELDKVVSQLEPTLKDHIFRAIDVKGTFLKYGRRLMLDEEDDVLKVYKHASDRIKGLLNSYSGWFEETERDKEEVKEEGQIPMIVPVENALCKWFDDGRRFQIAVCGLKNQVCVNFELETNDSEIQLEGKTSQVKAVSKNVHTVLMELREQESILKEVKWYREEKDHLQLFDDNAIVNLEKQHRKGIGFKLEIPQPQKVLSFDINFKKMTATRLDTKEEVNIVRWEIKELEKLPDYWEPMKAGDKLVVPVNPDSKEYTDIDTAFKKSIAKGGALTQGAIKIFRIQNLELWKQFAAKKETFETTMPGRNVERLLYHGTAGETVEFINKRGFNRSFAGKNAAAYGNGTYFAAEAHYSCRDTYSRPGSDGYKCIYLCRVLVGEYTQGQKGMNVPPPKPGSQDDYNSTVDNISNPFIFVIFNDVQAIPSYLIKFK